MHSQSSFRHNRKKLDGLLALALASAAAFTSGCTVSTSTPVAPAPTGNTTVTLLATSTANDQLSDYDLVLDALTLTNQNGAAVSVLSAPLHVEFIHLNGLMEPLVTVSIPQGTYTSAIATVGLSRFDCLSLNSSGAVDEAAFAYDSTPSSQVSVNLPAPITIGSGASALSLNLLVSQSAAWTACAPAPGGVESYSITPTFNLTTLATSSPSMTGLEGWVASVNAAANTFNVTADDGVSCVSSDPSACNPAPANGPLWQVEGNADTVMQGIPNLSQLQPGMPVEMDGSLQADGSVLASRISVVDTNTANLTANLGPNLFVSEAWPVLNAFDLESWGPVAVGYSEYFNFGNATFQTSGQFTDLQTLPFTASFTSGNMVAGQRLLVTSHATSMSAGPTYVPATTVTLLPQTVDGTVTAVSSVSGFDLYTVTLASYDLFPQLATQGGQVTLLQNPNTIMVYLSNSTPNPTPVAVGSVLRFNGLIFNDGGTLRMDCAQISDGVPE
jgi:Domain of unknown function (DUF5666)